MRSRSAVHGLVDERGRPAAAEFRAPKARHVAAILDRAGVTSAEEARERLGDLVGHFLADCLFKPGSSQCLFTVDLSPRLAEVWPPDPDFRAAVLDVSLRVLAARAAL